MKHGQKNKKEKRKRRGGAGRGIGGEEGKTFIFGAVDFILRVQSELLQHRVKATSRYD